MLLFLSGKILINRLAKDVKMKVGDVTILVNNAAVVYVTDMLTRTHDMITKTIRTNLLAHFRVSALVTRVGILKTNR